MQLSLAILILVVLGITGTFGYDYPKEKLYRGSAGFGVSGGNLGIVEGLRGYGQFGGLYGGQGYYDGLYGGIGAPGFLRGGLFGSRSSYYGYPGYFNQYNNIPYGGIYNNVGGSYGYGIDGGYLPNDSLYSRNGGLNNFGINGGYYGGRKLGKYGKY